MTCRAVWARGVCFGEMGWIGGAVETRRVVGVSFSLDASGLVAPLAMEEDIVTGSRSGILWLLVVWREMMNGGDEQVFCNLDKS